MTMKLADLAYSTLSAACGPADTSLFVVSAASFPSLGAGDFTFLTLTSITNGAREIVKVTAISGTTLTAVRAQGGTSAVSFGIGTRVELRLSSALIDYLAQDLKFRFYQFSGTPAASGALLDGAHDGDLFHNLATSDLYRRDAGSWGAPIGNLRGLTGPQGPQGGVGPSGPEGPAGQTGASGGLWFTGGGVPSNAIGSPGDFYLRGDNGEIYSKVGGVWNDTGVNIKGPAGAGSGGVAGLTPGALVFGDDAGLVGQHPHLHWDHTNRRLGVGTDAPANTLSVYNQSVTVVVEDITQLATGLELSPGTGYYGGVSLATMKSENADAYQWGSGAHGSYIGYTFPKARFLKSIQITWFAYGIKQFKVECKISGVWMKVGIVSLTGATLINGDEGIGTQSTITVVATIPVTQATGIRVTQIDAQWDTRNSPNRMKVVALMDGAVPTLLDITEAGLVGIGTPYPTARLDINNPADSLTLKMYRAGTDITAQIMTLHSDVGGLGTKVCEIRNNGDVRNTNNSYGAISDAKLKENITDATPKLAKLLTIQVRKYNLIGQPDFSQIGMIAQELESIFPGLVDEQRDVVITPDLEWTPGDGQTENDRPWLVQYLGTTTKSVKYSVFVPIIIKAIQEAYGDFVSVRERLEALEARVAALEGV
ncbi:MAG: tail fiber domain-containing protein [Magnetococcales bacterium]|nr:tail fiber domain-containing protein [Magnetococcales bacterium]